MIPQLVLLSVLWLTTFLSESSSPEFIPGTVLISRNRNEAENTTPGYWNHVAVVIDQNTVVESQAVPVEKGQVGVIQTSMKDFLARDYGQIIARFPPSPEIGMKAAEKAKTLVGLPFRKLSSLPRRETERREKRGLNCDSVARASYAEAMDRHFPKWKIPDRIAQSEIFPKTVIVR